MTAPLDVALVGPGVERCAEAAQAARHLAAELRLMGEVDHATAVLCDLEEVAGVRARFDGVLVALIDDGREIERALAAGATDTAERALLEQPAGWRVLTRRLRVALTALAPERYGTRLGDDPLALFRSDRLLSSTDAIVSLVAPNGHLVYVSPSVVRVLGWRPERPDASLIHPADRQRVVRQLTRLATAPQGTTVSFEFRAATASGDWRWLHTVAVSHLEDPVLVGIVMTSRDVSAERTTVDGARPYQASLLEAFRVAPCPLTILAGSSGRHLFVNHAYAASTGRSMDDLLARSVFDLLPEDERASMAAVLEDAATSRIRPRSARHRLVRPDGSVREYRSVLSVVGAGADGSPILLAELVDSSSPASQEPGRRAAGLIADLAVARTNAQHLARELVAVDQAERRRVRALLHDDTLQMILAALWEVEALDTDPASQRRVAMARYALLEAQAATRAAMEDLAPSVLEEIGLGAALRAELEAARAEGILLEERFALEAEKVPARTAGLVVRIVRALVAALRAANHPDRPVSATAVITATASLLTLEMTDNRAAGCATLGDVEALISAAGGTVARHVRRNGGCRIVITVPLS